MRETYIGGLKVTAVTLFDGRLIAATQGNYVWEWDGKRWVGLSFVEDESRATK